MSNNRNRNSRNNKQYNNKPFNQVNNSPAKMTEAMLFKKVVADFERNVLRKDSQLEKFIGMSGAFSDPDNTEFELVALFYELRKMILGNNTEAVRKYYNDDVEKVNNFVMRVRELNSLPKEF